MSWPFEFNHYEDKMADRPEVGNHICAIYDNESIVVYILCRSNIAYFAQAFQPFFLKSNSFKVGNVWEIRTSFDSAVLASKWGAVGDHESILALTVNRKGYDEMVKAAVQEQVNPQSNKKKSQAGFFWETGRNLCGEAVGANNLVLYIQGELLNHFSRHWIIKVFHMDIYAKAAKRFIAENHLEMVMVPHEKVYPIEPGLGTALGMDSLPRKFSVHEQHDSDQANEKGKRRK